MNTAFNHCRATRRQRLHLRHSAEARPDPAARPRQDGDVPDRSQWQHWLSELNDAHRTAVVLFHFCQMPYVEIAGVLNVPVNTVKTYLHRGRRRLRELITNDPAWEDRPWNVVTSND